MHIDASTLAAGGAMAVGTALVAGLGVIAFLLLRDGGRDDATSVSIVETATPAGAAASDSTPEPGRTPGWLVYRNDEFGFELEYPMQAELGASPGVSQILEREPLAAIDLPVPSASAVSIYVLVSAFGTSQAACQPQEVTEALEAAPDLAPTPEPVRYGEVTFQKYTTPAAMAMHSWLFSTYWTQRDEICVIIDTAVALVNPSAFAQTPVPFDSSDEEALLPIIVSTFRWTS
jgi:hypothetical protein